MPDRLPNILWYCTDQQRFDTIGVLGNPHARTPALDRLVSDGVAFTRAYCQHPICAPSRASFMTGRYPSAVHVNYNGNDYFPKEAEATLVSRLLAEAGYDCGLVGKLHLAGSKNRRESRADDGFRYFKWNHTSVNPLSPDQDDYADWLSKKGLDPAEVVRLPHRKMDRVMAPTPERDNVPPDLHQTTWCTEKALEFIGQAQAPWMLCVNVFYPHKPFNPPWEYYRRFDPAAMPFPHFRESDIAHQDGLAEAGVRFQTRSLPPDERNARALYAAYCAMVALVDDQFGRILSFLDETAQLENTVVLFTSDHGEMLGDHGLVLKGCRFYEGGVHVPLIWSWPEHFRCGMRSSALVELIDIAPTLLDLAGLPIPERTQGKSLLPILTGRAEPDKHREFVRSEYFDHRPSSPVHATMYRDDRWKIVAYHSADHDDLGELYDLENDPWEFIDLWQNPEYRDLKLQLLKKNFDARVLAMDPGPPQTMSF